ncbi:hypothetical protein [Microbacterium sp. BR1]|uniref:hypothetical protein n=1 Tax=Microbacterium sp. BR1 TaxID=1070896 RepID=UPI000C2C4A75|nr:hypothetical protein [Microbacterium sp. BR1]
MTLKEIVPESDGFTASNGVAVQRVPNGAGLHLSGDPIHLDKLRSQLAGREPYGNVSPAVEVALREFFRHEEDERLGRWRWPENPDYVVYPLGLDADGFRYARVLLERTGASGTWQEGQRPSGALSHPDGLGILAAMAFFDAHPEPEPAGHDAKVGEVWVLTANGDTGPFLVVHDFVIGEDRFIGSNGTRFRPTDDEQITDGHRIYPEDAS